MWPRAPFHGTARPSGPRWATGRRAVAALLVALHAHAPAAWAAQQRQNVWAAFSAEAPITGPLHGQYETQLRFSAERGLFRAQHRFALGYRAAPPLMLWIAGQLAHDLENERADRAERRIMGQLDYVLATPPGRRFVARTRLERRSIADSPEIGWRLRQRLAMDVALPRPGTAVVFHTEPMVALNDTVWGQASGFDRVRAYAGASLPVGTLAVCSASVMPGTDCRARIRLDAGYLNEWPPRAGREDLVDHVLVVSLAIRP